MKKNIRVGGTLEEAAERVADVWRRAERGETIRSQDNVTFVSWAALAKIMTNKRHELLRHLHRHPAPSVRALARQLGRDYKRVHEDVAALSSVGLLERDGETLRASYDEIVTTISLNSG